MHISHDNVLAYMDFPAAHGVKLYSTDDLDEATAEAAPQIVLPSGRMAVTGACLAVRRKIFDEVGGLDEDAFGVAFNDIDLCLRVRQHGLRTFTAAMRF
jgi:O-antigen biosynthesis protein